LTALPTLSPFVRDPTNEENGAKVDRGKEIEEFLKKEGVDVVVGCDLPRGDIVRLFPSFSASPSSYLLSPSGIHRSDFYTCPHSDLDLVSSAILHNIDDGEISYILGLISRKH